MNTCSVRDKAEDKVYSLLGTWRLLKAQRPGVIIGVGGCVASQEGDAIIGARAVCGSGVWSADYSSLAATAGRAQEHRQIADRYQLPEIEKFDHLPAPRAKGASAFVSIMEGCSKFCTYRWCPTRAVRK